MILFQNKHWIAEIGEAEFAAFRDDLARALIEWDAVMLGSEEFTGHSPSVEVYTRRPYARGASRRWRLARGNPPQVLFIRNRAGDAAPPRDAHALARVWPGAVYLHDSRGRDIERTSALALVAAGLVDLRPEWADRPVAISALRGVPSVVVTRRRHPLCRVVADFLPPDYVIEEDPT